jgi:uncharacterized sulfatase
MAGSPGESQFIFLNLMETHLPFQPPEAYLRQFAPLVKEDRTAAEFIRFYNTQALRWLLPMPEPFSSLQFQALSQMYDAEVAYQDALLAELLDLLDQPYHCQNSAVIIVADHGEMLGEHGLMGHGFGAYEQLVRVPLMVHLPGQAHGQRIREPVSTSQVFHTLLDLAGVDRQAEEAEAVSRLTQPLESLSLARLTPESSPATVVSEAYPPENLLRVIERRSPALLEKFHCRSVVRAVYNQAGEKLLHTEAAANRLFDLNRDPQEMHDLLAGSLPGHPLETSLEQFLAAAVQRRPENWSRQQASLDDQRLKQRLRSLGYLE